MMLILPYIIGDAAFHCDLSKGVLLSANILNQLAACLSPQCLPPLPSTPTLNRPKASSGSKVSE